MCEKGVEAVQRLTWTAAEDGGCVFGDWEIRLDEPTHKHPWSLFFQGKRMLRAHGRYTGAMRFANATNAKRWVERHLREVRVA